MQNLRKEVRPAPEAEPASSAHTGMGGRRSGQGSEEDDVWCFQRTSHEAQAAGMHRPVRNGSPLRTLVNFRSARAPPTHLTKEIQTPSRAGCGDR